MRHAMDINWLEQGGKKTLLKTTLHLKDSEVRKLREFGRIKLLVFCPSKKNGVVLQLNNKMETNPFQRGDALLSIEADEELFEAIMNPELRVTLRSENERADFGVLRMGPAHLFSSRDPLLEVMRYGYHMG